ncbi:MAG TPA: tetratricopeptide repeat protein [Polyangiaceae bacterium]|jgi:tetratricopeptide (TPR) repeat protein
MRVNPFAVALLEVAIALPAAGAWRVASAQESTVDALRATARTNANDPQAALAFGRALRRAGRPGEAIAELRRGVGLAGARADTLAALGWEIARVQGDRHDFFQMLAACRAIGGRAEKVAPDLAAQRHACAADAHLVRERGTEALSETAQALALDPQSYEAKVAEGRAEDLELDVGKSEAAFRAAIALRPDGVDAHLMLGHLLVKAGRKDEGIAELRRAVSLDADGPEALYELGVALAPSPESAALLEHSTRERPLFAGAWLELGGQELAAGRVSEAKRAAEAAVRDDGKSVAPRVLLGKVALADSRFDDALKQGDAALKILANSAPAELLVADADAKKGDIDRALEAYQSAWGLDRGDPTPLVHAAEACHAAGRDTSARAYGVKVTSEFPDWAPGWAVFGDALAAQGEKAAARDAYAKALATKGPIDRDAVQKKLAALR